MSVSTHHSGGVPPSSSSSNHSLAFRVMRLCRPSLQAEDSVLRIDPFDLLAGEDLFDDPTVSTHLVHRLYARDASLSGSADFSFRHRFQLQNPTDAMALSGLLVLPQSFGAIYLGETFCSYISINNSSSYEARDVIIKAEIHTERQRIQLLDTSKAPVESIRAGGRYDFIVEHDVKELGAHTLVCTALYNDGESERKYLPQFFKFMVANPLSVRTKVRTVKDNTYLEACIENYTKSNLYMDQVEFDPSPNWTATVLRAEDAPSDTNSEIREIFKPPVLIRSNGGIHNYLYRLSLSSNDSSHGSNILGKLQITWRTNLGEPGRLQTQQILGSPTTRKDIELRVVNISSDIIVEKPFQVHLKLLNHTDRTIGPFEISLSQMNSNYDSYIAVFGIQKLALPSLEALSSTNFILDLIAMSVGVHRIPGITVLDAREQNRYDILLQDYEIYVNSS